jgi:hypothetical protein
MVNLKKISTGRLLNLYRILRSSNYGYYDYDCDNWPDDSEELARMKAELDLREHVPRRRENRRKDKKVLLYRR